MHVVVGICGFLFCAGVGCVMVSMGWLGDEKSAMHQIYWAQYIIGGFVMLGLGVVVLAVSLVSGYLVSESQRQMTRNEAIQKWFGTQQAAMAEQIAKANQWNERSDVLLEAIEKNTRSR